MLVAGPIDLSRAELLTPVEMRDVVEYLPKEHDVEPSADNGWRGAKVTQPTRTVVAQRKVHGLSMMRALRKLNDECGKLANAALLGEETPLPVLEKMRREVKPTPKPTELSADTKRIHAERALGFLGKTDKFVERELLKLGRTKEQVAEYLRSRHAA